MKVNKIIGFTWYFFIIIIGICSYKAANNTITSLLFFIAMGICAINGAYWLDRKNKPKETI